MTKKDYELIAGAVGNALRTWTPDTEERKMAIYAIRDTALTLATALQHDNQRFDYDKFLKACGVYE